MSHSVLRAARLISVLTLTSRGLGLVRDMTFSFVFGVGSVQSAFALGFQIPNLFRMLFGEGAISAASIPVLTERLHHEGRPAMAAVAGRLVGLLLVTLTGLCAVAEVVVLFLYWRYGDDPNSALTLTLTGIMLPFVVMICPVAILGGIQNIFGRFALPAAMPILTNVVLITTAIGARLVVPGGPRRHIIIISFAVLIAGLMQLALQWWGVRRCDLRLKLSLDWRNPAIGRIFSTMLPMILGLGVVQLNTLADSLIAWWFVIDPVGPGLPDERPGTAILYFAQRLYQFPLGVFLVALATAIFPALARHAAAQDRAALSQTLIRGIRAALFIALPCMVGLILIREPLVRTLFAHGKFKEVPQADLRVAAALAMYTLGLWAYGLNHLLTRAFYALQDARTPLKVSVANVALNLVLNLILVQTVLREAGLALATAFGATLQVIVLLVLFDRRVERLPWSQLLPSAGRTLIAAVVMGGVVVLTGRYAVPEAGNVVRLVVMISTGAASYLAAVRLLRCPELRELTRR